jgi:tetratricopeptide (TPR) repeat protein
MAKPMLVTWPFLFLLLDIWPLKRLRPFAGLSSSDDTGRFQVKKLSVLIWEKIPFFLLSVVSGVLTYLAQQKVGAVGSFEVFSLKMRIANALISYISYIYKAILPFKLAIFYPHPGPDVSYVKASFATIVIAGVSLLVIMVSRRYHYAAIGWFWYLGTLVPVIGLIQVGSQAMADRYTYIPLIGLFIIVSWGGYDLLRKFQWHKYFLGVFAGLILTALAVGTYFQTGYWKNSITLFEHAVNVTENNWLAHNNLGSALDREGRLEEALYHIKRALEISPEYADALYNLGMVLAKCGEKKKGIFYYRKSLEKDPDSIDSHLNLANMLVEQGKTEEAILHYRKVLRIDPENSDTHNNLAVLYDNLGEIESVEFHYIRAINANPESVDANYNFGAFLLKQNRNKEAVSYIAKALAMIHTTDAHAVRPIYAKVFFDMGVELSLKGKFEEAIVFFKKALEIKPEHKEARKNLKILTEMLAQKE